MKATLTPGDIVDVFGLNLISSVRTEKGQSHDMLSVWNRGGLAGCLTVKAGDGLPLANMLARCELHGDMLAAIHRAIDYIEGEPTHGDDCPLRELMAVAAKAGCK